MIQTQILVIALVSTLLIAVLRPILGLCVFCASLFLYPQYLTVELGVAGFPTARLVIISLLAKIVFSSRLLRHFRWNRLDTFVLLAYAGQVVAAMSNVPAAKVMERHGGAFLDIIMPYLAARIIIRSKSDLLVFIRGLVVIGIFLAPLGLCQSVTWKNPMSYVTRVFFAPNYTLLVRHGLFRADVSFGNYIGFGMFFAALAPMSLGLLNQGRWGSPVVLATCAVLSLGMVSSMSSGPMFSFVIAMCLIAAFRFRSYWRAMVVMIVICCVFLEFYSNQHFYEVPTRLAFNSANANYRIGLYNEAFGGGMRDHWLCGYGYVGVGPGNDNSRFFWVHLDFTSVYIGILARYGLLGLVPFLTLTYLYYRRLYRASFLVQSRRDEWTLWCFSAGLVGWSIGTLTVGLVVQTLTMFYLLVGAAGNMPLLFQRQPATAFSLETGVWRLEGEKKTGERRFLAPGSGPQTPVKAWKTSSN